MLKCVTYKRDTFLNLFPDYTIVDYIQQLHPYSPYKLLRDMIDRLDDKNLENETMEMVVLDEKYEEWLGEGITSIENIMAYLKENSELDMLKELERLNMNYNYTLRGIPVVLHTDHDLQGKMALSLSQDTIKALTSFLRLIYDDVFIEGSLVPEIVEPLGTAMFIKAKDYFAGMSLPNFPNVKGKFIGNTQVWYIPFVTCERISKTSFSYSEIIRFNEDMIWVDENLISKYNLPKMENSVLERMMQSDIQLSFSDFCKDSCLGVMKMDSEIIPLFATIFEGKTSISSINQMILDL